MSEQEVENAIDRQARTVENLRDEYIARRKQSGECNCDMCVEIAIASDLIAIRATLLVVQESRAALERQVKHLESERDNKYAELHESFRMEYMVNEIAELTAKLAEVKQSNCVARIHERLAQLESAAAPTNCPMCGHVFGELS